MSTTSRSPTRRELLAATAAAGAVNMFLGAQRAAASGDSIRPFTVNIPPEEVTELRRRIAATRWPNSASFSAQSSEQRSDGSA